MTDEKRDELGRFKPGHSGNPETQFKPGESGNPDARWKPGESGNPEGGGRLTHGGERAIKRLADGGPLAGAALELKEMLHEELETDGLVAVMRERYERYQAVADLFYGLCLGCEDAKTLDLRVKRYGWLASKAHSMARDLREMQQERGEGNIVVDAMAAAREARNDDD